MPANPPFAAAAGAYAPGGTKLANATLIAVPETHQIAVGIPLSALNGLDLTTAYYGTAMFDNCQPNEGIGFVRPVYSLAFWSNPGPGLGFITQFYFGGGAGQATFNTPSNDTDTSDPNAIDIIVGARPVTVGSAQLAPSFHLACYPCCRSAADLEQAQTDGSDLGTCQLAPL